MSDNNKKKGRFSSVPSLNLGSRQMLLDASEEAARSPSDHKLEKPGFVDEHDFVQGDEAVFYGQKDGRRIIVSGTINKLIESLADGSFIQDQDYVRNFLITHRYFTTSEDFLNKLFERYHHEITPNPNLTTEERVLFEKHRTFVRLRIINVIKKWLETCYTDFETDAKLLPNLLDHINSIREQESKELIKNIVKDHQQNGSQQNLRVSSDLKKTKLDWHFFNQPELEIKLVNLSAEEVARHLTLIEYQMFREVPKDEFLNQGFNDSKLAPKMQAMIKRFNDSTSWIASEILREDDSQERTKILSKFIKIGMRCRQMNNFNGVMEVYSSLTMTPISRLKQTWAGVSPSLKKAYEELGNLMNPSNNYVHYRRVLKSAPAPVLPFQGVYLLDLTFIEENTNRLQNGLVNFEKMQMLGRLVREILHYQTVKFNFEEVPRLRDWLLSRETYSNEQLYSRSKTLEPSSSLQSLSASTSSSSFSFSSSSTLTPTSSSSSSSSPSGKKSLLRMVRFPSMKELFLSQSDDESKLQTSLSCTDRSVSPGGASDSGKKSKRDRRDRYS
eukprot:TRINITY_DN878_c0_g2_i1.p1 TRINITY_DN878_c0_g2~~TRINITY_DN878_c0_g2_i1.p1  ORF type:complete len:557 (-),score=126.65 TRINITY_DN878_c0_g2_i1:86-1756(-)